jgi:hypothetical protein
MAQTIRLTVTPDLEKALQILRESTLGVLNTTEIVKMAIGSFASMKNEAANPHDMDKVSTQLFHDWSRDDETLNVNNIAHLNKLRPYIPKA